MRNTYFLLLRYEKKNQTAHWQHCLLQPVVKSDDLHPTRRCERKIQIAELNCASRSVANNGKSRGANLVPIITTRAFFFARIRLSRRERCNNNSHSRSNFCAVLRKNGDVCEVRHRVVRTKKCLSFFGGMDVLCMKAISNISLSWWILRNVEYAAVARIVTHRFKLKI